MTDPTIEDARKLLNSHGHAFQYAVLRRAEELSGQRLSKWVFEAAEVPVGDAQNIIHIDFILWALSQKIYLVAECKRADPARANWCFVKAPYTRRNPIENELVFQELHCRPANSVDSRHLVKSTSLDCCHLGFELRTSSKGDGTGGGGSALKDATSQVLRGMNGLVDFLFPGTSTRVQRESVVLFLPVIFTTAALWVVEGDLSSAELTTGQMPKDWGTLKSVQWLWYSYNQSLALRHQLPFSIQPGDFELSAALHAEYTRSIAVVGRDGIDTFLKTDPASWF